MKKEEIQSIGEHYFDSKDFPRLEEVNDEVVGEMLNRQRVQRIYDAGLNLRGRPKRNLK